MKTLGLRDLMDALECIAPPLLAAEWDNTGLLLEGKADRVERVMLCLDLTPSVAAEALRTSVDLIVAYHPPIFQGLKTLTHQDPLTSVLLNLHGAGISVYSPHTALDAAPGGLSDWLASAFVFAASEPIDAAGRLLTLKRSVSLPQAHRTVAAHLRAPYLRVAKAPGGRSRIRRIALCPGAGASVLRASDADLVLTGELKHHDILEFVRRGVHVVISEHGYTERPYLAVLRKRLLELLPSLSRVDLAKSDREPLVFVPSGGKFRDA
jgi:dinuclear metal center YbgI/SA1388 family protein